MATVITLLQELKGELQEVRADIGLLKEQIEASSKAQPKRAVITVPSIDGWEQDSITLSTEDWSRVKRGESVVLTSEIDFGGTLLRNHWEFCGGIGGTIKRDIEWSDGDIETEYEITLVMDDVEEIDEQSK